MPDLLTLYALTRTSRPSSMTEPEATSALSHAEFETATNRLARPDRRAAPDPASRWPGAVRTRCRLAGRRRPQDRTAVPVNYRFSEDEAAFVTDHSDASLVFVDAEFARCHARAQRHPEGPRRPRLRWTSTGRDDRRRCLDGGRTARSAGGVAVRGGGGDDDLYVGHDRQAEGRRSTPSIPSSLQRCCSSSGTRPTTCT